MASRGLALMLLFMFTCTICEGKRESVPFKCRNIIPEVFPKDCAELATGSVSGIYTIKPTGSHPYSVYCDMETNGGGWTVFQRREDGSVNFFRNWTEYENGFGLVRGEFWLGNIKISNLCKQKTYNLRIDMKDLKGYSNYALYDEFVVKAAEQNYTLHITGYQGNAGDAMMGCNNQPFSTSDRDHDNNEKRNCANTFKGGWWYSNCFTANINGLYLNGSYQGLRNGIEWPPWTGIRYSLSFTEMKLKPKE